MPKEMRILTPSAAMYAKTMPRQIAQNMAKSSLRGNVDIVAEIVAIQNVLVWRCILASGTCMRANIVMVSAEILCAY